MIGPNTKVIFDLINPDMEWNPDGYIPRYDVFCHRRGIFHDAILKF